MGNTKATNTDSTINRNTSNSHYSDTVTLCNARRIFLLSVAVLFISGCAVLSLGFRAVPKAELATVGLAVMYVQAANILQPSLSTFSTSSSAAPKPKPVNSIRPLTRNNVLRRLTVRLLIFMSLLLSVIIPWTWLLAFSPSTTHARMLGPHLFLMMTQVLFEIWGYRQSVSSLVRISIPVGFVAYRLRLLIEWTSIAYDHYSRNGVSVKDKFMLGLAISNLSFWCIILFYVLLLKVCPQYFIPRR